MATIPPVLLDYIQGLAAHDVERVAGTVADDLRFVAATRVLDKPQFLAMLRALYTGFPDWHYDHDPIEARADLLCREVAAGRHPYRDMEPVGDGSDSPDRQAGAYPRALFLLQGCGESHRRDPPGSDSGGAPRGILQQIGVEAPPL